MTRVTRLPWRRIGAALPAVVLVGAGAALAATGGHPATGVVADSRRAEGPLTCPADAIRVNTSHLTFEQVVTTLEDLVRERVQTL